MTDLPVVLRDARAEDENFILHSWLASYRGRANGAQAARVVPKPVYFHWHQKILKALLARCRTVVAVSAEDEDQILGYIVWERMGAVVVHYLYVKETYRGLGLARLLFEQAQPLVVGADLGWLFTHGTKQAHTFAAKFGGTFNPYLMHER